MFLKKGIVKIIPLYLKIAAIVLSIVCVVLIVLTKHYSYIILPIAVVLAVILKKEHRVSELGVSIYYELFGKPIDTIWYWNDIDIMMIDDKKTKPDFMIYFKKNLATRAFKFSKEDTRDILDFVKTNQRHVNIQYS